MMKYILVAMFLLSGCASASYEAVLPDGTNKKITYKVVGKREFKNVKINPDTGMIELGAAGGDAGVLGEAISDSLKITKKAMGVP